MRYSYRLQLYTGSSCVRRDHIKPQQSHSDSDSDTADTRARRTRAMRQISHEHTVRRETSNMLRRGGATYPNPLSRDAVPQKQRKERQRRKRPCSQSADLSRPTQPTVRPYPLPTHRRPHTTPLFSLLTRDPTGSAAAQVSQATSPIPLSTTQRGCHDP